VLSHPGWQAEHYSLGFDLHLAEQIPDLSGQQRGKQGLQLVQLLGRDVFRVRR